MRAGGGAVGDELSLTADLGGGWRPGYQGLQWDSTPTDNGEEWVGRIEIYETGPATEPDPANWVTVLAFKLAD